MQAHSQSRVSSLRPASGAERSICRKIQAYVPSRRSRIGLRSDEREDYQQAVISAIGHATKEWVFFVASDYQSAPIAFHNIILGVKYARNDPFYHVRPSWGSTSCCRC